MNWSPIGDNLALGSFDGKKGEITIWDPQSGELKNRFDYPAGWSLWPIGHDSWWSRDGKLLAVGRKTHLHFLEASSGQTIHQWPHMPYKSRGRAWSPDGNRIAFIDDGPPESIRIVETKSGREFLRLRGIASTVSLMWSPDGRRLAANGIQVWDANPGYARK
jgi:WD40 repeat protein